MYPTDIKVSNPEVTNKPGGMAAHTTTIKIHVQNNAMTPYEHPNDMACFGSFVIDVIKVRLSIPAKPQVQNCKPLNHEENPPTNQ